MEKNLNILSISREEELPDGKVISYAGDEFAVNENLRKEILVWDISRDDKKMLWLLSVKSSFNSLHFMQIISKAEKNGYKVVKKGIIDHDVLAAVYDKRIFSENQKATGDDSLVVQMFEVILADSLSEKISDIHFEVRTNGAVIKMRKNGDMMVYKPEQRLTYNEGNNLCAVMYNVLASTKAVSFDPRECQQAAVDYTVKDQQVKLRYQSVPAYPDGYDVILRVLPVGRNEEFTPLDQLGYTNQQVKDITNITSRPVGSLIIAGVTGSGKSTTMKNVIMYINAHNGFRIKIYSIEDPPEYNIPKITQIPVVIGKDFDPTKMSPFEKPIKACMRGDPDIIMIGEVRDKITGDLTKKAIQSGHQVLTTVHATSALGIIDRFQDFGLSPSVLGSPDFLTGLIYQKLLPVLCNDCSIDFMEQLQSDSVDEEDVGMYKRLSQIINPHQHKIKLRNKEGCKSCKYQGIKGRTVCAEVIYVDINMLELISNGKTIELMKYWRELNDGQLDSENMTGKTCMEHAFQKMLRGQISPYDVESSFKPLDEMLLKVNKPHEEKIDSDWKDL